MKKILSIDGGGIKGIYAASFLAQLEQKCNIQICDYFDLIVGTSTGGIIAGALALGIPAVKILDLYIENGSKIFPKKRILPILRGKYQSSPLEDALKDVFQEKCIKDCKTRLMMPTFCLTSQKVRVFKTPHAKDLYFDCDYKMVDCLLATTAAPTYFNPHKMENGIYIDGGVGANNPSLLALVEGLTRCEWKITDIAMLSIGGVIEQSTITGEEKMGYKDVKKIIDCFMTAESQYAENICSIMLPKSRYVRVNKQVIPGQVALDKASMKHMERLKNWGYESAMGFMDDLRKIFFNQEIECVQYYNVKG